ncbi:hypothetical protein HYC85_029896 [Camellia sinensis]|uniref:Retrotransposon gag domain-containing protein n=1 Tax=Camellia sinensis TaxID=4442 RepID=A0A7J7G007_CAMSI|nr:hypothetical protein HYC85_029896 [Camellia sinensis]
MYFELMNFVVAGFLDRKLVFSIFGSQFLVSHTTIVLYSSGRPPIWGLKVHQLGPEVAALLCYKGTGDTLSPHRRLQISFWSTKARGHRVCRMLFLNGLPEARFEKRAIRLTGCGLCHDGNTNPDFTGAPSLTIRPTQLLQTKQIFPKHSGQEVADSIDLRIWSTDNQLQQQTGAPASHQAPPPPGVQTPGEKPNVQEGTDIPVGPAPPPILLQLSKTPTNLLDSPFEFEVDPTALKLSKLEKLFKKSQEVKPIPDIEDGYTDVAVMLPDRFKMPQIDRFDGFGDPMVHLRLFSDILRPMGLTRPQKLSLFGWTLSGVAAIWYAKLEDNYSYNTQIEITTRDLETTRQEPKESFSEFEARWREKASMMTLRPTDKDQIRMIMRNLQPKLMQKMIVLPFPTFSDLHEMRVQIEDALKEQPRRTFNCNNNTGTSNATNARASEVSMVTTIPPPRPMANTPFSGAFGSNTQTTKYQPRGQRTFTPLYMPLSKALGDLVDKQVIVPPEKSNVITSPLPSHNQAPPPKRINFIQTGVVSYELSIYITPSHLPKPEVLLSDCTDLCMLDISRTQPEPMVVTVEDRIGKISGQNGIVESESEESGSFTEEVYSPSDYILLVGLVGPNVELPAGAELCVIEGDEFGQRIDDLAAVEEDFANFQFFNEQDPEGMVVNWSDFEESAESSGGLMTYQMLSTKLSWDRARQGQEHQLWPEGLKIRMHRRRAPVLRISLKIWAFLIQELLNSQLY